MGTPTDDYKWDILLAIDGSDHSIAAIDLLRDLPLPTGTEVTAVTVLIPRNASDHASREAILEQTKKMLAEKNIQVNTELLVGYPTEQLVEYADEQQPDLIVLGAKGLRSTLGILVGGVAQQVLEYAACPVLVVRAPYQGLKNVLLVTDGSYHSQRTTEYLSDFRLPESTQLRIMHVLPPLASPTTIATSWPIDAELFAPPPTKELEEALNEQATEEERKGQHILERATSNLRSFGIEATSLLRRGDAATEIIEYVKSNQIDLVIAGSRGLSGIRSWLLGSVSRKLVHYAGCSVLVVKSSST
ncbi:MAG TPA: universal stress protein [Anaerolineales bacterium]|jgi:nucleotide-binding universal stress UspA family protein|nr:universal stress protein [Anaerolineales bacterium]